MGPCAPFMEKKYMMKKDHNFRLPKEVKCFLSSMDKDESKKYKNLMIEGIISGSVESPREKRKNKNKTPQTENEE